MPLDAPIRTIPPQFLGSMLIKRPICPQKVKIVLYFDGRINSVHLFSYSKKLCAYVINFMFQTYKFRFKSCPETLKNTPEHQKCPQMYISPFPVKICLTFPSMFSALLSKPLLFRDIIPVKSETGQLISVSSLFYDSHAQCSVKIALGVLFKIFIFVLTHLLISPVTSPTLFPGNVAEGGW